MNATIQISTQGGGVQIITSELPLAVFQKNEKWIAYSPMFKTLGYSSFDQDSAVEDFFHSLDMFFTIHIEDNTLEEALSLFNWKSSTNISKSLLNGSYSPSYLYDKDKQTDTISRLEKRSHTSILEFA